MGEQVGTIEVRLRADIAKLESDLRKAEGKTKTAGAKMSKAFNGMTKSVLKFAGAAVGIAAVSKLMQSLVKNAGDDEAATKRLGGAMKSAGIHSDELATKLKAQAEAYDLISAASETELTHAQAFLLNMGVTVDQMDVALDASTNLAAAMGWDLTTAVRNVGKTMGGFAGELAETIPELKAMSRETLMAGGALRFIADKFSGQALEDIQTFQGRVGELGDSWEVFSAQVGGAITNNEGLQQSITDINDALRDPENAKLAADFMGRIVDAAAGAMRALDSSASAITLWGAKFQVAIEDVPEFALAPSGALSIKKALEAIGIDIVAARIILAAEFPEDAEREIEAANIALWNRIAAKSSEIAAEEGAEAGTAYLEAMREKLNLGGLDYIPQPIGVDEVVVKSDKPTTPTKPKGPLLTGQEIKAQQDFFAKLRAEKHTYNEDYAALEKLRVDQAIAAMERLKLSATDEDAAIVLIRKNSTNRLIALTDEAAEAEEEIRIRSRDSFLNATGQEILAIEERLAREIEAYEELEEKGEDWSKQKIEAAAIAASEIKTINEEEMEAWDDLFSFMEDGFSDALATMLLDGEFTFKQLGEAFLREFIQKGIEEVDWLGGLQQVAGLVGLGSSVISSNPVNDYSIYTGNPPTRAHGGPLAAGTPALVGERGPELFMPGKSGFVATNQTLQSMMRRGGKDAGVNITVINNTGEESSTNEKDGPNGERQIEVMIGKAVSKNISKGGNVDQAIRNSYGVNRVGRHGL